MSGEVRVLGVVRDSDERPTADIMVRAFAVRLRDEQQIGEARTDGDGRYEIGSADPPGVLDRLNLRVAAIDTDGSELASSPVRYRAGGVETIDLVLPPGRRARSEYERYLSELEPALSGQPLADLSAAQTRFLSGDTRIPEAHLDALVDSARRAGAAAPTQLAQAAQHSPAAAISGTEPLPTEVWYAWHRDGVDLADASLWRRPLPDLVAAVRRAAERGVIPATVADQLDTLTPLLDAHRLDYHLDTVEQPGGSLRSLLATLPEPLEPGRERTVARVLVDERPPPDRLSRSLQRAGLSGSQADQVVRTLLLGDLTGGNPALVGALQSRAGKGRDTTLRPLSQVPPDEWLDLAYAHGVPPGSDAAEVGADGAVPGVDLTQCYAARLRATLEDRHPTATLAARLADRSVLLDLPGGRQVGPFLTANPGFDILTTPVDEYLDGLPSDPDTDRAQLASALLTVRRVRGLTTTWDETASLLQIGLTSAIEVAGRPAAELAAALADRVGAAEARAIHRRAVLAQNATVALLAVVPRFSPTEVPVLESSSPSQELLDRYPTLQSLFGSQDTCACGQCRSVLSPAAYLVDLLEWLRRDVPVAFDQLLRRRPDLVDLELSCANGDTRLPVIDLALEVLENVVGLPLAVDLPPGTDVTAALSGGPLPLAVIDVLRLTALDVTPPLWAAAESRQLQQKGYTDWTVSDRYRTWTLRQSTEALHVVPPSRTHQVESLPPGSVAIGAAVTALDQGTLPADLDEQLRAIVGTDPLTAAGLELQEVTVLDTGRRWRVSYLVQLRILGTVDGGTGTITMTTADGTPVMSKAYSRAAVVATTDALTRGEPGGLVPGLLSAPGAFTVAAGPDAGSWLLRKRTMWVEVEYTPSTLVVESLTYQSDPAADALAAPQNRNPSAYQRLRQAQTAWLLPFDLPVEEIRVFLDRAGLSRKRLMELWYSSTALDNYSVAFESLGLSLADALRLETPTPEPLLWAIWGAAPQGGISYIRDASTGTVVSGPPLALFARVSVLLQQAGIGHPELLDLMATRFIRVAGVTPGMLPLTECRPSETHLEPVNAGFFDRLHRFIQLWRRLGWTVAEVDAALTAVGEGGEITAATLRAMTHLGRLRDRLRRGLGEVAEWYSGIGTATQVSHDEGGRTETPSLFDRLFHPAGETVPADLDLTLNADRTRLSIEDTLSPGQLPRLRDKLAAVSAAFRARPEDLAVLLDGLPLRAGETRPLPLTLQTLSRLYREARLAGALGLSAADYTRLAGITGIEPFPAEPAPADPRPTVDFCEAVDVVKSSGFSPAELDYLLRHVASPGLAAGWTDDRAAALLIGVRAAMQAVQDPSAGGTGSTGPGPVGEPDPADRLRTELLRLSWYVLLVDEVIADLGTGTVGAVAAARLRRRLRCATLPVFTADTERLDPAVSVPARLRERCHIEATPDGAGSRLMISGWVEQADEDVLKAALDTANHPARLAAVGRLRAASDSYVERLTRRRLLDGTEIDALIAVGTTVPDRYRQVLAAIGRHLQIDAAAEQLGQSLDLPADLVRDLLLDLLTVPGTTTPAVQILLDPAFAMADPRTVPTAATDPAAFALVRRLRKIGLMAGRLSLGPSELAAMAGTGPLPAGRQAGILAIDLNMIPGGMPATDVPVPFLHWRRLSAWVRLRARGPALATALDAYAAAVIDVTRTPEQRQAAALAALATALEAPAGVVGAAAHQVFRFGLSYYDAEGVAALLDLVTALTRTGLTPTAVPALIGAEPPLDDATKGAAVARSLLRSRYRDAAWSEVVRPVSDRLRERQRDALVEHLVHTRALSGPQELYDYYLIDVLTAPCMDTTRIITATAAVQLFVHRCLLGLEPAVVPSTVNQRRWDWMKAYRLWEANRKVFLWPQNWLHPELREDASDPFRTMHSALGHGEPSSETAREALTAFLDDLVELSQATVIGMYQHRIAAGPGSPSDLYIVVRTSNPPQRYFWRVCADFGGARMRWRPWERVELDISGTHVMPFVLDGDLHLAWPVFRKSQSGDQATWDIQLAWARRTSRGWSQKNVSRDVATSKALDNVDERRTFTFRLDVSELPVTTSPRGSLTIGGPGYTQVRVYCYASDNAPSPLQPASRAPADLAGPWPHLSILCEALYREHSGSRYWAAQGVQAELWVDFNLPTVPRVYLGKLYDTDRNGRTYWAFTFARMDPNIFALATFTLQLTAPTGDIQKATTQINPSLPVHQWYPSVTFVAAPGVSPPGGTDPERPLVTWLLGAFTVTSQRPAEWNYLPGRAAPSKGAEPSRYLEDGFAEDLSRTEAATLVGPRGTIRFGTSPGQFVAIPAMPPGADVWHYADGAGQYLLQSLAGGAWYLLADGHRLAPALRSAVTRNLVDLYSPATQSISDLGSLLDAHQPVPVPVPRSLPEQGITFDLGAPSAGMNWELFLHIPVLAAKHLSRQQRFADADEWLRLVFDPTRPEEIPASPGDPRRFWRFLPFRTGARPDRIEDLLTWLANPAANFPGRDDFARQISQWRDNPFRPHEIARMRPGAYQWDVLFAYLDNLIAWGDDRFRRDTRESLVEATMLYVQAANVLGPRPATVQPQLTPPALSYRSVRGRWDDFANVWYSLADNPFVAALIALQQWLAEHGIVGPDGASGLDLDEAIATLASTGLTYFCVPHNEKLLGYWSTVEHRLFRIRHCQNIEGVERQLPLYPPPFDPDLLIRAVAAGVDLDTAVAGATAPPSPYRFAVLHQRATELAAEVTGLGSAVLAALEKRDAERLAQLRAEQEVALLGLVEEVRRQQVAEAQAGVDALTASRDAVASRYRHLQLLLTGGPGSEPPEGAAVVEQPSRLQQAPAANVAADAAGLGLLQTESDQMARLTEAAWLTLGAGISSSVASVFFAIGAFTVTTPVQGFGHSANAISGTLGAVSSYLTNVAGRNALVAGYQRRQDDWQFQSNNALRELVQIDKQLAAARIRVAVAEHELTSHQRQVADARAVEEFMRDKHTNAELYDWLSGQLGGVYFAAYGLALTAARQAEGAFRYELYQPDALFIRPRYWDTLRHGLAAGEQLAQDLRRMAAAHLERNRRELELTRNFSLRQLHPLALLRLRATGWCEFDLTERVLDLDFPGLFLRRIKSVSVTMPCVAGPYTAVHAKLSLQSSTVRHQAAGGAGYDRAEDDDPRFTDDHGLAENIVTSGAVDASGVWEPSLRDERRMPFEGRGAISRWRLELPADYPQFNHDSISDVVLTLRYSARDGGEQLRKDAVAALDAAFAQVEGRPLTLLVSLWHEFPSEWARFVGPGAGARTETFELTSDRFPALFAERVITVRAVDVYSAGTGTTPPAAAPSLATPAPVASDPPEPLTLTPAEGFGRIRHDMADELAVTVAADPASSRWAMSGSQAVRRSLRDVLLVLTYTATTSAQP